MGLIRANEQYKVKVTDFEGPLDLLLHLIKDAKLDIKTVKLAEVTGQYMSFLAQLNDVIAREAKQSPGGGEYLNLASEFIEVGATLVEIKARGILPGPEPEKEDPEDVEMRLRAQLEEYKLLKEAGEQLKTLENVDRFYKEPAVLRPEYKYVLDNLNMDALVAAFTKIMHRMQAKAAPIVERQIRMDRFTVKDKINDIRARVRDNNSIMFFELFDADFTKSEMINTFLALLELLKTQEIKAVQDSLFSDIRIIENSPSQGEGVDARSADGVGEGGENGELVISSAN